MVWRGFFCIVVVGHQDIVVTFVLLNLKFPSKVRIYIFSWIKYLEDYFICFSPALVSIGVTLVPDDAIGCSFCWSR